MGEEDGSEKERGRKRGGTKRKKWEEIRKKGKGEGRGGEGKERERDGEGNEGGEMRVGREGRGRRGRE